MAGTFTHANMRIGPAVVTYGGQCVGVTLGPVEFRASVEYRPRTGARWGSTPVDFIHCGETCSVQARLAENSVANLALALPEGITVGTARYFGRKPGGQGSDHAARLVVRPVDRDANDDDSEDLVLHKAVVTACEPVAYTPERERVFAVTFTAIVDDDKDDGKKLGYIRGVT